MSEEQGLVVLAIKNQDLREQLSERLTEETVEFRTIEPLERLSISTLARTHFVFLETEDDVGMIIESVYRIFIDSSWTRRVPIVVIVSQEQIDHHRALKTLSMNVQLIETMLVSRKEATIDRLMAILNQASSKLIHLASPDVSH